MQQSRRYSFQLEKEAAAIEEACEAVLKLGSQQLVKSVKSPLRKVHPVCRELFVGSFGQVREADGRSSGRKSAIQCCLNQ